MVQATVALCPTAIFLGAFCPTPFEALCPTPLKPIVHNSLQRYPPRHYAPFIPWHSAPPWHYAPVLFAHLFFSARFSIFWHDFRPQFYFWHAINPYHQRSYKVPRFVVVSRWYQRGYGAPGGMWIGKPFSSKGLGEILLLGIALELLPCPSR